MIQERGARAKPTQADRARRKSLMSSSSQVRLKNREHMGNQMQCFHQGARNRETYSRVLFLNTPTRQILENLFLKAIKIIFPVRQDLREQVRPQEELSLKEKVLRDARNGRNEESSRNYELTKSVQKSREDHETIQKLTSQLQEMQDQEMQDQMSSVNDSGEFKKWNQITEGDCLTLPVNLQ